jgi:hypothetical protein
MNTSSFQIMKYSWQFLWNHKKIVLAILVFGLVTLALCASFLALIGASAWLIFGTDRLLFMFQNIAAGVMPLLNPWLAISLLAIIFVLILLCMFYPRICSAVYVLHAMRSKPITIKKALSDGFRFTRDSWHVIVGLTLVPLCFLSLGLVVFMTFPMPAAIIYAVCAVLFLGWFYMATYFIEQLVADGFIDFAHTVATSWNFVKRSWWQIVGIFFFLWLTNVLVSLVLAPLFFSIFGIILSSWYSVASNKIYLIVRSETQYKYSSE